MIVVVAMEMCAEGRIVLPTAIEGKKREVISAEELV